MYDSLDKTHFQALVVFVAGIGFLTDGYDVSQMKLLFDNDNAHHYHYVLVIMLLRRGLIHTDCRCSFLDLRRLAEPSYADIYL